MRDEAGFTIQELLVVLLVGSMLVSFSISTFLFLNRLYMSWHHSVEMHQAVTVAAETIAGDVQHSCAVHIYEDSTCLLERELGKAVLYRFGSERLSRNSAPMLQMDGLRISGMISPVQGPSSGHMLLLIKVKGVWKDRVCLSRCIVSAPQSSFACFDSALAQSLRR